MYCAIVQPVSPGVKKGGTGRELNSAAGLVRTGYHSFATWITKRANTAMMSGGNGPIIHGIFGKKPKKNATEKK